MSDPIPKKLRPFEKKNFTTLMKAQNSGDLALISAIRKSDNKQVALVCAMGRDREGNYYPTPLAVMLDGNPYDDFYDPTM